MKNSLSWIYALAAVVVLLIVASLFMNPAIRMIRVPWMNFQQIRCQVNSPPPPTQSKETAKLF